MVSYFTIITSISLACLGLLVYLKNKKSEINISFSLICFSSFIWMFSYSFGFNASNEEVATKWFKIGYSGVAFIAATYYHFSTSFANLKSPRKFIYLVYLAALLVVYNINTNNNLVYGVYKYFWGYYPKAGKFHFIFLIYFLFLLNTAVGQLAYVFIFHKKKISSIRRIQLKYSLIALGIYTIASIDFIPNYGFEIFPFGFVPATIFLGLISFSIVKYRLMDIPLAITRFSIFAAVYSIVLGIPFVVAFNFQKPLMNLLGENWWGVPLVMSTILSFVGPRTYLYFQKRAEDRLLQEQRQYQDTMRKASLGMGRIKDLHRLLNLIVHVVARTVRIEHCEILLLNKETDVYELKASKSIYKNISLPSLPFNSPLIQYLKFLREPVVYEEIKERFDNSNDKQIGAIEQVMRDLNAEIVVPSFIDQKLITLIVLGKKKSGKLYSQDDLVVFSILANQSALAIENALFYEDVKRKNEQLFKAEKMATIGTMADGLSHQINNRLHAMGFIAGDAIDSIQIGREDDMAPDVKELLAEIENAFVRIQKNVTQGGEVVEGLLKWTRKSDEGYSPVDIDHIIDSSFEMIKFKVKIDEINLNRQVNGSLPKIKGNATQLQEVFFNLIDNAYDAMIQRKHDLKEAGYEPMLEVSMNNKINLLEIIIRDNGIGVKSNDMTKLFTPFFTTKITSKKGTGLGLYVIRQIIEKNHGGRVELTSEYQKGSQIKIVLPVQAEQALLT
jgi:signal transduction histidine kinase